MPENIKCIKIFNMKKIYRCFRNGVSDAEEKYEKLPLHKRKKKKTYK